MNLSTAFLATVLVSCTVDMTMALRGSNKSDSMALTLEAIHNKDESRAKKDPVEEDETKDIDFVRDVVAPVQAAAMAKNNDPDGSDRRLQAGAPECFILSDGSLACAVDDFPAEGLVTALFDCTDGASIFQCQGCTVVFAENLEELEASDPQCNSCFTCGNSLSYDCSNFSPTDPCATRNCNGDCIGNGGPAPTPSPPRPTPPPPTLAPPVPAPTPNNPSPEPGFGSPAPPTDTDGGFGSLPGDGTSSSASVAGTGLRFFAGLLGATVMLSFV